jgi:hypothetical protein
MNLEIQNFPRAYGGRIRIHKNFAPPPLRKFRPLQKFWKTERLFKLLEYYPRLTLLPSMRFK